MPPPPLAVPLSPAPPTPVTLPRPPASSSLETIPELDVAELDAPPVTQPDPLPCASATDPPDPAPNSRTDQTLEPIISETDSSSSLHKVEIPFASLDDSRDHSTDDSFNSIAPALSDSTDTSEDLSKLAEIPDDISLSAYDPPVSTPEVSHDTSRDDSGSYLAAAAVVDPDDPRSNSQPLSHTARQRHALVITDGYDVLTLCQSLPDRTTRSTVPLVYSEPATALEDFSHPLPCLREFALRAFGQLPRSWKASRCVPSITIALDDVTCHLVTTGRRSIPSLVPTFRHLMKTRSEEDAHRWPDIECTSLRERPSADLDEVSRQVLFSVSKFYGWKMPMSDTAEASTLSASAPPFRPSPLPALIEEPLPPSQRSRPAPVSNTPSRSVSLIVWRTDPLLQTPHVLVPIIEGIPTMPRTAVTANSLVVTHHAASSMIVDLFDDPVYPLRRLRAVTQRPNQSAECPTVVPLELSDYCPATRPYHVDRPDAYRAEWVPAAQVLRYCPSLTSLECNVIRDLVASASTSAAPHKKPTRARPSRRARRQARLSGEGCSRKSCKPETQQCMAAQRVAAVYVAVTSERPCHQLPRRVVAPHLLSPPPEIRAWLGLPSSAAVVASEVMRPATPIEPFSDEVSATIATACISMLDKPTPDTVQFDRELLDRLIAASRARARGRGATRVTPRDVKEAAEVMSARHSKLPTSVPIAPDLPAHWDQIQEQLAALRLRTEQSPRRPLVLVLGETRGVIARMFRDAGADVATCDLDPSEDDSIPHFQGDASDIQDLGWDLVIGHPPCVYLANAGVMWLTREEGRIDRAREAAATFRRMQLARAPFVAIEQPVMHRLGRQLTGSAPAQIIHPWQHGTGHTKPTALHLSPSLPLLAPTCVVPGRLHRLATLSQSPDRGHHRSRTYEGIAAAMATQWMPCLLSHLQSQPSSSFESASTLVEAAATLVTSDPIAAVPYRCSHGLPVLTHGPPATGSLSTLCCSSAGCRDLALESVPIDSHSLESLRETAAAAHRPMEYVGAVVPLPPSTAFVPSRARRRDGRWFVWRDRHDPSDPPPAWQPVTGNDGDAFESIARRYGGLAQVPETDLQTRIRQVWDSPDCSGIALHRLPRLPYRVPGLPGAHHPGTPLGPPSAGPGARTSTVSRPLTRSNEHANLSQIQEGLAAAHRKEFRATFSPGDSIASTCTAPMSAATASGLAASAATVSDHHAICYVAPSPALASRPLVPVALATPVPQMVSCDPDLPPPALVVDPDADPAMVAIVSPGPPTLSGPSLVSETETLPCYPRSATAVTPPLGERPHCAYLTDFVVSRPSRSRHGEDTPMLIDRAVLRVHRALADTGAGPSIITTEMLDALLASHCDACVRRNRGSAQVRKDVVGANGAPLVQRGTVTVEFTLSGRAFSHDFLLVDGAPLLILGNDFLTTWISDISLRSSSGHVDIEHPTGVVRTPLSTAPPPHLPVSGYVALVNPASPSEHLDGSPLKDRPSLPATSPSMSPTELIDHALANPDYMLYSDQPIRLNPQEDGEVWLRLPKALESNPGPFFIDKVPANSDLDTVAPAACGLVYPIDGRVPVRLWNLHRHVITIPSLSPVASLSTQFTVKDADASPAGPRTYTSLTDDERTLIDQVKLDPDGVLTPEQLVRARNLLATFVDVFARNPKSPAHTHLLEVDLPLKPGATPHVHSASRHGEAGRAIVDAQCAEMEANGIIRKSNSPWGSRVVLIVKKTGDIRFCIDYRDTNSKLMTLDSPIPRCEDAIDRLASGRGPTDSLFLSTLDLASGFWTLPIAESSKPQTAFVTHRQKYEFNYLPFGIQSGPSWMCRLIDASLSGLAWETCMPYLDDCAIWSTGVGDTVPARESSSFDQMIERLTGVFERFRWAGMSPKASKTVLFATRADFLGHVVSREGLEMDPKKISAVSEIDPKSLDTVEKVRSFLGLVAYYRRFIDKFTDYAAPLYDLTRVGCDVAVDSQSEVCQQSFRSLIDAITSEPVLAMPRFDRPFAVKTDGACTHGLGAVLTQKDDDGRERPVAYWGRKLTKHERNYTVTEVELLACVSAIKQWRSYLWGRHFTLVTDHSALRWLHTMKDTVDGGPASRLTRWSLRLQEFDFEVEHKPGKHHHDADAVSRLVSAVDTAIDAPRRPSSDAHHLIACGRLVDKWLAVSDVPDPNDLPALRHELTQYVIGATRTMPPELQTFECLVATPSDPDAPPAAPAKSRKPRTRTTTARSRMAAEMARAAVESTRASIIETYTAVGTPTASSLRASQAGDDDCAELLHALATGSPARPIDRKKELWIRRQLPYLTVVDGILHRIDPPLAKSHVSAPARCRPWIPSDLRYQYLMAFHDRAGHQGVHRTAALLTERFYWPKQHFDIHEYVKECHECTLGKANRRVAEPVVPGVGRQPYDTLVVDLVDMALTHDGNHDKCIVFVDQLTRWVEVVPVLGDPDSKQLLDAFMEHVVCRHGAPRVIRSDLGPNLASRLTKEIMRLTGIDLAPSTAHHHQSAGVAERFNATLASMCRTANQGGSHWRDHLPFLLFSHRATPNRITKMSPAFLLYGRELRLPAQLDSTIPTGPSPASDLPAHIAEYALKLQSQLVGAWAAARDLSVDQQIRDHAAADPDTSAVKYEVNDMVCRLLPDHVNKLQWQWAGPYRVKEVLPDGNYKLWDLENVILSDIYPSARLRPYRTFINEDELQPDEFIVDELMKVRGPLMSREFLVKWRQFPRSQATWEPEFELRRRCTELIADFDLVHQTPTPAPPPPRTPPAPKYIDSDGRYAASKILFVDPDSDTVFAWYRKDGKMLDVPGGSRDATDLDAAAALRRELREEVIMAPALARAVDAMLTDNPHGHTETLVRGAGRPDTRVTAWAVHVPRSARRYLRPTTVSVDGAPTGADEGDHARFYSTNQFLTDARNFRPAYGRVFERALLAARTATAPLPPLLQPLVPATPTPLRATFVRGAWAYEHTITTPHGPRARWHPAHYFDATFDLLPLRRTHLATLPPHLRTIAQASSDSLDSSASSSLTDYT